MENTQGEKARTRRDLVENSRRDSDNSNNSNNSNNSSHWRSSIQIDAGIIIVVVLMLASAWSCYLVQVCLSLLLRGVAVLAT